MSSEKVRRDAEARLDLYAAEMDKRLSDAKILVSAAIYNADLQNMLFVQTKTHYQLARYRFWYQLYSLASTYQGIGSMFVYLTDFDDMLTVHFEKAEYDGQDVMRERMRAEDAGAFFSEQWIPLSVDVLIPFPKNPRLPIEMIDRDAVLRILHPDEYESDAPPAETDLAVAGNITKEIQFLVYGARYDGFQLGVWMDTVEMLGELPVLSNDHDQLALYDEHGLLLAQTAGVFEVPSIRSAATPRGAMFLKIASKASRLTLALITRDYGFLRTASVFQIIVICAALLVFIALPVMFIRFNASLLAPLQRMYGAIRRIGEGDLTARIEVDADNEEFLALQNQFNEMMECIETLKISVYENRLKYQEAEYERLQLQINPHFFLNNLNMIHSFAALRSYAPILQLTENLSGYFRAALRRDTRQIRLADETSMVKIWLDIQKMRYPNRLYLEMDMDKRLYDATVPVMILLTFVENAVKYAMDTDKALRLRVTGQLRPGNQAVLMVEDNGYGFDADMLLALNSRRSLSDETGRHIGIANLLKRMESVFTSGFSVVFSNEAEGGARVMVAFDMIAWRGDDARQDMRMRIMPDSKAGLIS